MIFEINPKFKNIEDSILAAFNEFDKQGVDFMVGDRNKIKIFETGGYKINIKSFKIPNKLNQFVYKFIRPSKAKRSFEYANILLSKGIDTPEPIAYQEFHSGLGLQKSFYASIHQDYDLTYRELVEVKDYPDEVNILKQFTAFCYKMHEAGIEFKDHSPGNTLIKKVSDREFKFFLVDLNRMKFHEKMSIELRMKNLSRLTPKKEMVQIMAEEYARISNEDPKKLFDLLWNYTESFQTKYHRKQRLKRKIKSSFNS